MATIGFLGTGHIAAPMVRFLGRKGHDVVVSERNAGIAQVLARDTGARILANQQVIDASDIVFLCLRPDVAAEAIGALQFRAGQQIVSVMAGVSLAQLQGLVAPADDITLTIPLGFLEQGGCPLPACPDAGVLRALFEPENPVIAVTEESALNLHFAICAMVPGVLDLLATGAGWLSAQTGDPDGAERYAAGLLGGFLTALAADKAGDIGAARDALATDGTLSLQMVETLQQGGAHEALTKALTAIGTRLNAG